MPWVEIKVKGCLDEHWVEWFDEFSITHTEKAESVLSGNVQDQSALYGLITRLRDLGLSLLELTFKEENNRF